MTIVGFENLSGPGSSSTFKFKNNAVFAGAISGAVIDYSDASNTSGVTFKITGVNGTGHVTSATNAFSTVKSIVGTPQADTYLFTTSTASLQGTITGSGGADTLDFTGKGSAVVDLTAGTAYGVTGGISGIYNVTGSAGADTIIGDGNNNIINGLAGNNIIVGLGGDDTLSAAGTGYNIIIGGAGNDTITGGSGAEILIGGSTVHDTNTTNLTSLMSEWSHSGVGYSTRIDCLTGNASGGLNGSITLTSGDLSDDAGTGDSLTGGAGLDWFITYTGDVVNDLNTGGTETQTGY